MKRKSAIVEHPGPLQAQLEQLGFDAARAQSLVEAGAVYVGGKRARGLTLEVAQGAKLTVVLEESGRPVDAAQPRTPVVVVFEDRELVAVDKPAGVTSQPTEGRQGDSMLDRVSAYLKREAGLVHRLDKETSGVLVFAKTKAATSKLAAEFREGRAAKRYLAAVAPGVPAEATIELPLSRDSSRPGKWRASKTHHGVPAVTVLRRLGQSPSCDLVELLPKTGRTHQLRAHLAGIGHPIVGDKLYGGAPGPRCLLHAERLEILGRTLVAPLPEDMAPLFEGVTPRR